MSRIPSRGSGAADGPDLRRTDAYAYELPPDRIARYPTDRRDASRLLVVRRGALDGADRSPSNPTVAPPAGDLPPAGDPFDDASHFRDLRFAELPSLLREGDLLVLNESRVLPARLLGRKPTGAPCEVLLLRPADRAGNPSDLLRWEALVRPGSKLKPGREVLVSPELSVRIEEGTPEGGRIVRLCTELAWEEALERYGRMPLPPYLEREDEPLDRERYQTVYARNPGSVAAPTAGLHFTPALLETLELGGVRLARVTLHVGPGTFRPVEGETIEEHPMHPESWHVPADTAAAVRETRARSGRVWAVGTTVVRTLESAVGDDGLLRAGASETRLFISPGFRFRAVDGLITNFHLPRSTLLMLVAAFGGHRTTMEAYAHAVATGYRFYSYGDAMLLTPGGPEESG